MPMPPKSPSSPDLPASPDVKKPPAKKAAGASVSRSSEDQTTYLVGETRMPLPDNLFIPPDALEVFLKEFSGPLDILLFLIRKRNMDIAAVNIAEVANQYLVYIRLMKQFKMHLAAEYLVMAAILIEIKSRALLAVDIVDDEEDILTAELLVEKIKAYEVIQQAMIELSRLPRLDRDQFIPHLPVEATPATAIKTVKKVKNLDARKLSKALANALKRKNIKRTYEIRLEELSTRERMAKILDKLNLAKQLNIKGGYVPFSAFWSKQEGAAGAVVSFVALMQLIKEGLANIRQDEFYAPIDVCAGSGQGQGQDIAPGSDK